MVKRIKKSIILLIVFYAFSMLTNLIYENRIYAKNILPKSLYDNSAHGIAVVGDSYAGRMAEVDKDNIFKYFVFTIPGIDQEDNVRIFNESLYDNSIKYILFTTSVNDQGRLLHPNVFKKFLNIYAERARENNKYLFFHTYMNVSHDFINIVPYKSNEYDNVLKEIANIYPNVYYIDMNNFNHNRFLLKDRAHYKDLFHETLKAKFLYNVHEIEKRENASDNQFSRVNDDNYIMVTGDSYAGTFYTLEKDKKYRMEVLAIPNRTILDNDLYIRSALLADSKYVLLSTGVNDFKRKTNINVFEDEIRRFANIALEKDKTLFLHTYMDYVYYEDKNATLSDTREKYNIKDYDDALKRIAEEYEKVIYIDMSEYNNTIFMMPDYMHYGIEFNDALYNKIDLIISKF